MKCEPIYFKLKDGRDAVLRNVTEEDIPGIIEYIRLSAEETPFLLRTPEECDVYTYEKELAYVKRSNEDPDDFTLCCIVDGKFAGNCGLSYSSKKKLAHRGNIGIALIKEFWNQGIGTKMFEAMIADAKSRDGVTQLELDFIEGNTRGRALYEKMGFEITGFVPDAIRLPDGTLLKEYHMVKKLYDSTDSCKKEDSNLYPITELYPDDKPVVDPEKFLKDVKLGVEKMIITFFPEVMNILKETEQIELFYVLGGENPVEIYKFKDREILITLGQVGCPSCAGNLECFYAMGVKKVIFCGGGGVLDKEISVGKLLVVDGAIRDEGFSFQYIAPSRIIYSEKQIADKIANHLERKNVPYLRGITWTTDALFRETTKRVAKRKEEGAKIVEMEQAGCIAVAQYKGFQYGAIIYGGDDVSGNEWDHRDWRSRNGIRYDLVMLCKDIVEEY